MGCIEEVSEFRKSFSKYCYLVVLSDDELNLVLNSDMEQS